MDLLKEQRQKQKQMDEKVMELEEKCRIQEELNNQVQKRLINKRTYDWIRNLRCDQDSGDDDIIDSKIESYDFVG